MNAISELYNALPIEVRKINSAVGCEMQIRQLEMEKSRLKKRYSQSIAEINEHISAVKRHLAGLEKELFSESEVKNG